MDIFFSHSKKDAPLVREVKNLFPEYIKIIVDEIDFIDNLSDSIEQSIVKADFMVVFISENSINSEWVLKEIEMALEKEKVLNRPFVVCAWLDACKIPEKLKDKIYVRLHSTQYSTVKAFAEELKQYIDKIIARYAFKTHRENNHHKEKDDVIEMIFSQGKTGKNVSANKYEEIIELNSHLTDEDIIVLIEEETKEDIRIYDKGQKQCLDGVMDKKADQNKKKEENATFKALLSGFMFAFGGQLEFAKKVQKLIDTYKKIKSVSASETLAKISLLIEKNNKKQ